MFQDGGTGGSTSGYHTDFNTAFNTGPTGPPCAGHGEKERGGVRVEKKREKREGSWRVSRVGPAPKLTVYVCGVGGLSLFAFPVKRLTHICLMFPYDQGPV